MMVSTLAIIYGTTYSSFGIEGTQVEIERIYVHENYNTQTLANDIAIMKLAVSTLKV